jgi:hypothetical protein
MEAVSTSETSVNFYHSTRRNNPEDSHLHTRRRENLKCQMFQNLWDKIGQTWIQVFLKHGNMYVYISEKKKRLSFTIYTVYIGRYNLSIRPDTRLQSRLCFVTGMLSVFSSSTSEVENPANNAVSTEQVTWSRTTGWLRLINCG